MSEAQSIRAYQVFAVKRFRFMKSRKYIATTLLRHKKKDVAFPSELLLLVFIESIELKNLVGDSRQLFSFF